MKKLWVASYPRSGNTFLRLVLHQAFGIRSTSVYPSEDTAMRERPWLMERIGYAGPLESAETGAGEEWLAVKTHSSPPPDDGPAIYVVRDGRAAIPSYLHMLRAYTNTSPTLAALIKGETWPGSWSDHFNAWQPETRPRTLLLKYEDLRRDIDGVCCMIAGLLGVSNWTPYRESFADLHSREPALFRSADNAKNIAEIEPEIAMYDELHGDLMRRLGYS